MSADLIVHQSLPAMSITEAVQRRAMLVEFTRQCMVKGVDFGIIPGTSEQTLLKPGAEKLCTLFGLSPRFTILTQVEDWSGTGGEGEPLFYYLYRCSLYRGGTLIAEGDGSCNSREKKYRYRQAQRLCPQCEQPAIIKVRAEYGGGWVCYRNRGGCGAKFADGAQEIEGQEVGQIINPDICDLVNTIQKMAQKRSLIASTLLAVNASEFFTQDVEDIEMPWRRETPPNASPCVEAPAEPYATAEEPPGDGKDSSGLEQGKQDQVLAELAARREAIEYTGPIKPLIASVLGGAPEAFRLRTYREALARSEEEWRLAAERLSAQISGKTGLVEE